MSAHTEPRPKPAVAAWQIEFVEQSSAVTDLTGLPPSVAKVFLWLVVCEPPEQSSEQLRDALGVSAAAISTATATLATRGLVERVTPTGERRFSYRLHPRCWERLMRYRLESTTNLRTIFDTALATAGEPHARLADLRAMYAWFEQRITELLTQNARTTPTKN